VQLWLLVILLLQERLISLLQEQPLKQIVGNTTVAADANTTVTGQLVNTFTNSATVTADANVIATGVSISGFIGNTTTSADANVTLTGISLQTNVGNATTTADANVIPTGVQANSGLGFVRVTAWQIISPNINNTWVLIDPENINYLGDTLKAFAELPFATLTDKKEANPVVWQEINTGASNNWTPVDLAA